MELVWVSKAMMVNLLAFRLFSFNFQCNSHLFFSLLVLSFVVFKRLHFVSAKTEVYNQQYFVFTKSIHLHLRTGSVYRCVSQGLYYTRPHVSEHPTWCLCPSWSRTHSNMRKRHLFARLIFRLTLPEGKRESRSLTHCSCHLPTTVWVSVCVCVHWCHPHGWLHICGHGRFHSKVCLREGKVAHCTFANFKIMNSHVCSVMWKTV